MLPASPILLIGYSGHSYTVCGIFQEMNVEIRGYFEDKINAVNPFNIHFLGRENDERNVGLLSEHLAFVAIGDNLIRKKIQETLTSRNVQFTNAIHPKSMIARKVEIGAGSMIAAGAIINPLASIGRGNIINTGAIVEHECVLGSYVHIAPGAVLCGNVWVGEGSFVGANAVVKQGVKIGKNCTIGAGSVVLENVNDGTVVAGNPAKRIG